MHARTSQNPFLKKVIESQTIQYVSAGGEKHQKPKNYYSAIQSPEKVLQRYKEPLEKYRCVPRIASPEARKKCMYYVSTQTRAQESGLLA